MSLRECLQLARDAGFDGIELNYDLASDLSPRAGPRELQAVREAMERELAGEPLGRREHVRPVRVAADARDRDELRQLRQVVLVVFKRWNARHQWKSPAL